MTIAEMLALPSFRGTRVAAGARGLGAPVRGVHVIDMPEPESWIRSQHLLLTTGYTWPQRQEAQRHRVRAFVASGLACIGLAVPRFLDGFPAATREEAERLDLPLLEIPWKTAFAEILDDFYKAILDEQLTAIRRAEAIHRRLTEAAMAGSGFDELARILGELIGRSVTIEDQHFRRLGGHSTAPAPASDAAAGGSAFTPVETLASVLAVLEARGHLAAIRGSTVPVRVPPIAEPRLEPHVIFPIRLSGELAGSVWIVEGDRALNELDHRAAEQAALVAALRIAHQRELATLEARLGYASFLSLLESDAAAEAQSVERVRLLGFDPEADHQVAVALLDRPLPLDRDGFTRRERLAERLRQALQHAGTPSMLAPALNRVVFLMPPGISPERLREQLDDPAATLLLGRTHPGIDGARRSYREALALVPYDGFGPVRRYAELVLPRVLLGDAEARRAFLGDLTAPIRAARNGRTLLATLLMFAREGFHFKATARRLAIHRNTLRYRLDRVADLLGVPLDEPELRFRLQLAARLLDIEDALT